MNYEVFVLLMMVASGALLGVIYDSVRAIKLFIPFGRKVAIVTDFLYWVFVTLFVAYMLLVTNDGIIRAYEFCGIILGAVLYFFTVSRWILWLFKFILGNILKIFDFIFKILLTPLRFLDKILVVKIFKKLRGADSSAEKEKTEQKSV